MIYLLYYDGFCEFEVVFSTLLFKDEITTVALKDKVYQSEEKQKFVPDMLLDDIEIEKVDLFIIPGGSVGYLYDNKKLKDFLTKLNKNNKLISGICAGSYLLASYGLLDNRKCTGSTYGLTEDSNEKYISLYDKAIIIDEDVVVDNNIITSIGQAFAEFTIVLGRLMNKFDNIEDEKSYYKLMKNIK